MTVAFNSEIRIHSLLEQALLISAVLNDKKIVQNCHLLTLKLFQT